MSEGQGIDTTTILIVGIIFLVAMYAVSDEFRIKLDEIIDAFLGMLNMKYSGDDKIAEESVQALACAVDVTAYYSNPENKVPETGIKFAQFKSCAVKGELSAPVAPAEVVPVPEIEGTPPATTTTGETAPAKKEVTSLTGSKVSCGGVDYYLSASNVDLTKNSVDIKIDYQGGTKKTATLTPYNLCPAPKVNCFVYSGDYSEKTGALKGIKANIQSTPTKDKKVLVRTNCIAESGETSDAILTGNLFKNIALSNAESRNVGFSAAVIAVTKSLGDRITGWAAGETATPNKKCFGGEDRCVECEMKDKIFSCNVKAFELPQKIKYGDGALASIGDYAKAWTGFIGEPYYLAYYETFPRESGAAWSYDNYDIAISAIAFGAVLNAGGGVLKVGKGALKSAGASITTGIKEGITTLSLVVRGQGIRQAFKKGGASFEKQVAEEYGEKVAPSTLLTIKASSAALGTEEVAEVIETYTSKSILKRIEEREGWQLKVIYGGMLQNKVGRELQGDFWIRDGRWLKSEFLDAGEVLISGSKKITSKDIDEIIKTFPKGDVFEYFSKNKNELASELEELRKMRRNAPNQFITIAEQDELKIALKGFVGEDLKDKALDKYVSNIVSTAFKTNGKWAMFKNLVSSKALRSEERMALEKTVKDGAEGTYLDTMRLFDSIEDPSLREAAIDAYLKNWNTPIAGADKKMMGDVFDKYASEVLANAEKTAKASPKGLGKTMASLNLDGKKKIIAIAIGASTIGMSQHMMEKYETTCGAGNMCLHTPSIITKTIGDSRNWCSYNNRDFPLTKNIADTYKGVVMLRIPTKVSGLEDVRFNLASPCKTDLKISLKADCKCAKSDTSTRQDICSTNQVDISNCEAPSFLGLGSVSKKCIVVEPNTDSMKEYSEKGNFGENFCFKNPKSLGEYIKPLCTVGTIAGGAILTGVSWGLAAPAVLLTMGATDAACTQVIDTGMANDWGISGGPWPASQY